jgi:hypothetical protein
MAAYDRLPPAARQALQDAVFDWAPYPILCRIRRGAYSHRGGSAAIVRDVRRWDREALRRRGN